MSFMLDARLQADCVEVANLELSKLLLMDNRNVPWLILVPRKEKAIEITDLSITEQHMLLQEINLVTQIQQKLFNPDKINTAAIGNIVAQLHVHVIGRFKTDPVWPAPVWGNLQAEPYHKGELQQRVQLLRHAMHI
ncbi:HIT family protein [Catenovulum sp. 2E275]|uniref:HIT family protein n=1 Tax=Catenovulum sp. 2E275 TaxID=2980497 RepID=UPI0021D0CD53|nr:HIT family protein [Catenovulum sp. 2E275]MCU4677223.1 HIT family protein [Catenovulum sp. 2E275]